MRSWELKGEIKWTFSLRQRLGFECSVIYLWGLLIEICQSIKYFWLLGTMPSYLQIHFLSWLWFVSVKTWSKHLLGKKGNGLSWAHVTLHFSCKSEILCPISKESRYGPKCLRDVGIGASPLPRPYKVAPPPPYFRHVVKCVSQIAKQVLEQTRKFSLFRLRYFSWPFSSGFLFCRLSFSSRSASRWL